MVLLVMLMACFISLAQEISLSKDALRELEDAREIYDAKDFDMVRQIIEPLLEIYPQNAELNYLMGASLMQLPFPHHQAKEYLDLAISKNEKKAVFWYAKLLFENEQVAQAKQVFLSIDDSSKQDDIAMYLRYIENADSMMNEPQLVVVQNLGFKVNSPFLEHTPLISWDDSVLVFTSRRPITTNAVKDFEGRYDENILISNRGEDGWQEAQPLIGNVNDILNDAAVSMSTDEDRLLIFKTSADLESGNLYWARHQAGEWKVDTKLPKVINSERIENGAAVNSNGNEFIFSSNRAGGYGGFDLYRVVRFGNGDYSQPVNLGPIINTKWDEQAPFLLQDDRTLFFASNRVESMGGLDIFFSRRVNDSLWSASQNLGFPINSTLDDAHIAVSWKGGRAYFTKSKQQNQGDYDIHTANLPGFNVPANVFKCVITSDVPVDFSEVDVVVEMENQMTYELDLRSYSVTEKGGFIVALFPEERGLLEISLAGFDPIQIPLNFSETEDIKEISLPIQLKKSTE